MPEEKDFELSPRIEELQEKLSKEPKSRIFLQLAEEYRKSGMPEEAITVCQEGLKHHPSYISAKVTLGKAYLDLKKVDEALHIFEDVIEQAPDNLMANRNLGDIFYMKGYADEALKHYKVINMFNPNDKFVADRIKELSAQMAEPEPITVSGAGEEEVAEETAEIEPSAEEKEEAEAPELILEEEEEEEEPTKKEAEIDLQKKITQEYTPIDITKKEEISPMVEAPPVEEELPPLEAIPDKEAAPAEEIPAAEEVIKEEESIPQVQIDLTAEEVSEEGAVPKVEIDLTDETKTVITPEEKQVKEEIAPEVAKEEIAVEEKAPEVPPAAVVEETKIEEEAPKPEEKEIESVTLADLYAKQGLVDKAIETYQHLLVKEPDNLEIKARLEQLILKRESERDIKVEKSAEEKEEKPPSVKEDIQEAKPSAPLDESKKEKVDTLSKWLENIRKLK